MEKSGERSGGDSDVSNIIERRNMTFIIGNKDYTASLLYLRNSISLLLLLLVIRLFSCANPFHDLWHSSLVSLPSSSPSYFEYPRIEILLLYVFVNWCEVSVSCLPLGDFLLITQRHWSSWDFSFPQAVSMSSPHLLGEPPSRLFRLSLQPSSASSLSGTISRRTKIKDKEQRRRKLL
ncbi:unnamed protein product [Arabidopsis thaliana]|uniref:(thale cress) hypothetical protein n=1 Tax=Arabidopsis thaliana TaxID=3702 RepID=A0A7G2F0Z4_ARATH|nr:unnamed protein product [Arabidopsis thaliana]